MSFKRICTTLLDIIFPRRCVGCGKEDVDVCHTCLARSPFAQKSAQSDLIFSLFAYQNKVIKKAIWALKYSHRRDMAAELGAFASSYLIEELADKAAFEHFTEPLLVPIPLSARRRQKRGFNQAELLARAIASHDPDYFTVECDTLKKTRETKSQMEITVRSERLGNLRGCFAVKNPDLIKKRNIILIDDITTTGATIKEARKVLLAAGAKKVIGFTVAH